MAPGLSRMETPAMLCEMGNSATVASFAEPPGPTQCVWLSMSYLKFGSSASFGSSAGADMGAADTAALAAIPASVTLWNIFLRLIGIDRSSLEYILDSGMTSTTSLAAARDSIRATEAIIRPYIRRTPVIELAGAEFG